MKIENLYERIAKWFGLELGQEFNIVGKVSNPYHFEKTGLYDGEGDSARILVHGLLLGELSIEICLLLTEEEKDYLETVIKYSKYPITHLGVAESDRGIYVMCQCDTNNGTIYSDNLYVNLAFKNMKIGMMYTPKELGLED